ncbi:type I pullulanase [Clostridium sp. B9]|uniref:type I pullulanase n=1 Tax=Clostridium sp. B9 TaxID=3423224 RepID=UPI003D2EF1DE
MRKIKKVLSVFLSFVFILTLAQIPKITKADEKNSDGVYIKIRYNRPDQNYDGWNLWTWERDLNGTDTNTRVLQFIGKDDEGEFAVLKTNVSEGKLGFILRRSESGNDWAENYFGKDNFVDLSKGDQEVIINHKDGERDFEVKPLNRNFEKVTLNLHYYRFDGSYDNWDIWSWLDGVKGGEGYPLTGEDSYGKVSTIVYDGVKDADPRGIGIIVRKSDWSDKDVHSDRFINLAYANNKGEINAYLVQNNPEVVYRAEDAVKDPAISSAKIDSINEINFKTNVKMSSQDMNGKITLKENGVSQPISVTIPETLDSGKIITENKLDLTKEYTLEIEGFKPATLTLGKIFADKEFEKLYHYNGELGSLYKKNKTDFVLWAPMATSVKLALYNTGDYTKDTEPVEVVEMTKGEKGIWTTSLKGDKNGVYYDYLVTNNGKEENVTDPYAKAVGVNGRRAMVIDLSSTNPEGWNEDKKPEFVDPTDAIIYEIHIRDFSIDESSNTKMEMRGKYEGMWQPNTTLPANDNIKTGIDHLKELGVTHVHLLPTFDHRSIDETKLNTPQYNWGYDPQNYNVPEGSYSTDPYKAEVRIKEFKEMVQELHKAGIRVVMDVVYNHTGATTDSHLNLAVPDYYYRQNASGSFSNGSGCGNEIASERSMVRKMMVDSVKYWADEYHIDGFRFDLMGLHDIETMKTIRSELDKIDPSIIIYGEGWTGGDTPLPEEQRALKKNTPQYGEMQIAAFSDDMRDGVKGHVFDANKPGFVNGYNGLEELVKFGVVGSVRHDGVKYGVSPSPYEGYGVEPWANEPYQTVNYVSAHDNLTLWDKLQTTNKEASKEELNAINKMASAIVLTSQGIPFFQGGEEMARTKVNPDGSFNHNSYNAPDSVNKVDWTRKEEYNDLFNYYKGLIELRKSHKAFRMNSAKDIQNNLTFLEKGKHFNKDNIVAYTLNGKNVGDKWNDMAVIFNANKEPVEVTLPMEDWAVVVNGEKAGTEKLAEVKGNKVNVPAQSSYVLVQKNSFDNTGKPEVEEGKPVIEAKDLELKRGEKFDPLKGVTASDKEDGDLSSKVEVVENTVDTNKAGEYKVTYSVVDKDGNKTTKTINVKVVDDTDKPEVDEPDTDKPDEGKPDTENPSEKGVPVISAKDLELKVGEKFDPLKGVTASDKEDGDLTPELYVVENTVNSNKAGEYKVTYGVSDKDGNKATKTITVKVLDKNSNVGSLPNTGGMSSSLFGVIGIVLVILGAIFFKKKKGITN